jgi:hypothetical protein
MKSWEITVKGLTVGLKPHNIVGDNFVLYFQVVSSSCVGFTELIESEPYIRSLIYMSSES